jgi:hypothetical protein
MKALDAKGGILLPHVTYHNTSKKIQKKLFFSIYIVVG